MVVISGGFDPIHVGHIRLIKEASKLGDVYVLLNSDKWLARKKGRYFMNWEERAEILESIKGVVRVCPVDDSDDTVCSGLRALDPSYFVNGGDRKEDNTPELKICKKLGIIPVFNIGGDKIQSSSELLKNYAQKNI